MKKYILYNPLAGNGEANKVAEDLSVCIGGAELMDVTKIESYRDFMMTLDETDEITICGGDGTLNQFVNGIRGVNVKNKIYFCPSGSGNDFVRDIADDGEVNGTYEINKYIERLPIVNVNGEEYLFVNGVGYGIDGYCCEEGDKLKAKGSKKIDYTSIAIKGLLFKFKPVNATVIVDGKRTEYKKVWIAPTMNGRYYGGGMMPTPEQNRCAEDGKLSLMVFHGSGKIKTLAVFPSLFKGEHVKHTDIVNIHIGYDITVEFDTPTALQIDGETIVGVKSYTARSSRIPAKIGQ